jgi:hypothetical protein
MIKKRAFSSVVCLLILTGTCLTAHAEPLLSQGKIIGDKIMVFPDHATPNVFYYVPTGLELTQAYGKPQFFFYKYVYIKSDPSGETERMAGGVLTFSVEFRDESTELKEMMGRNLEFKPIPVDELKCSLNYSVFDGEEKKEEELSQRKAPWTKKNFTLPLSRKTAPYLWEIFEGEKALGLSMDCVFTYSGYELKEGKYEEAQRIDRMAFPVGVSMTEYPDLFTIINLANKVSFNYRHMTVLCFDFVNETNPDVIRKTVEIEIQTARGQKDFKRIYFSKDSETQQELEFDIPEKKGGRYRYRVAMILKDGRTQKSEWQEGDDFYLDVSEYEIVVKDEK